MVNEPHILSKPRVSNFEDFKQIHVNNPGMGYNFQGD